MGPLIGEDGVPRCPWAGGAGVMRDYHDEEWGRRVHGEAAYLERLTLEAFQSGLSWSTILNKRPAFREVFHDFDAEAIAAFDDADFARLMDDARIVRNRLKIQADHHQRPGDGRAARPRGARGAGALLRPRRAAGLAGHRRDGDDVGGVEGALARS